VKVDIFGLAGKGFPPPYGSEEPPMTIATN